MLIFRSFNQGAGGRVILVLVSGAMFIQTGEKKFVEYIELLFGTLDSIDKIEWKPLDVSFESTDVDVIFSCDVFKSRYESLLTNVNNYVRGVMITYLVAW